MSTCDLYLHHGFESQFVPMQEAERGPRQLDLPIECLRILKVVARWLTPRKRNRQIVYFGNQKQFVCIGTMVRRVGA